LKDAKIKQKKISQNINKINVYLTTRPKKVIFDFTLNRVLYELLLKQAKIIPKVNQEFMNYAIGSITNINIQNKGTFDNRVQTRSQISKEIKTTRPVTPDHRYIDTNIRFIPSKQSKGKYLDKIQRHQQRRITRNQNPNTRYTASQSHKTLPNTRSRQIAAHS
jgi:hypothetical protein